MEYLSGQKIPDNVFAALQLTAKSGFITKKLWHDHFATGNYRWRHRQLKRLCERQIFEPHPNPVASDCFVLGRFGRVLLARYGARFVRPPFVSQLSHDEAVAHAMLSLREDKLIHDWHLEIEMKTDQMKQHQLNRSAKDQKYPDAIFKIRARNKERLCAVEYERTRKSPQRYRDILWLYSQMKSFWVVMFVCETAVIASSIKRQLRHMNEPNLNARVGIAAAHTWIKNPATAPIELDEVVFGLRELCGATESVAA